MSDAKTIFRLNIAHFERLLATETDLQKRETITRLLAEERLKLRQDEQNQDRQA